MSSGYLSQQQTGSNIAVAGNATTSMNSAGMLTLAGVQGQDDAAATFPVNFDFFFFGSNYGSGANSGIYWSSNNVLGFGTPDSTITWTAVTGRGILLGNYDRRCNNFYYYSPTRTFSPTGSGLTYYYIDTLIYAQNVYNDGVPNAIQFQMRLFRSSVDQYVEIRCKQAPSTAGTYNITNGVVFQNTYGAFANMVANQSFVLRSNNTGSTWTLYNNYYIPAP
jgi:hypothetical protein